MGPSTETSGRGHQLGDRTVIKTETATFCCRSADSFYVVEHELASGLAAAHEPRGADKPARGWRAHRLPRRTLKPRTRV